MGRQREKKDRTAEYLRIVAEGVDNVVTVDHMTEERIVPTMLTAYNRAVGVGGHPLGCVTLIHGPNQVGKSVLAMALTESLRRAGHPGTIFDSEYAGEKEWYSAITPRSGYKRIPNLDELIGDVQRMEENLAAAKKAGKIPEHVGNVYVPDTLTKLLPKKVLDEIRKKGVDKMYPIQAMYFSVWFKSVIPMLEESHSSMIVVLQERSNMDKSGPWDKDHKVTGGHSLQYDNRIRVRVSSIKKIHTGSGDKKKLVGMRSRYIVENNKIVGTSLATGYLYTANGAGDMPKGLDLVREALEEAKEREVLRVAKDKKGRKVVRAVVEGRTAFSVRGGWEDAREALRDDPEKLRVLVDGLNDEASDFEK